MQCPGIDSLRRLVERAPHGSDSSPIHAHIDACVACRQLLSDLIRAALAGVSQTPTVPLDPAFNAEDPTTGGWLKPGVVVGRYVIRRLVGLGGMGFVYAAHDPRLDRQVALKIVKPRVPGLTDAEGRTRLLAEAQLMARVVHPNIVAVYDVGSDAERVFVAMELVDGVTVKEWLKQRPRRWREILDVFRAAGRGLAAAHAKGLIHRDFKPANILVHRDGRVLVTDFGLARSIPGESQTPSATPVDVTRAGLILGTPAYMAPEQHRGERADRRSDQFSFSVALHEALYGERPFAGDTSEALRLEILEARRREPPKAARVPAWVRRTVVRGLAHEPAARWPSVDALLGALDWKRHSRRRWALANVAGLLLIGLPVVALSGQSRAPDPRESAAPVSRAPGVEQSMVGINLAGLGLDGMNLTANNLAGLNLGGTNLAGTKLAGDQLGGTNLAGMNLGGMSLTDANLSGLRLVGTNLAGVDLAGISLAASTLAGSHLAGAHPGSGCPIGTAVLGTDLDEATAGQNIHGGLANGLLRSGEDLHTRTEACVVMGLGSTAFATLVRENDAPGDTMYAALRRLDWGISTTSGGPAALQAWEAVIWGANTYSVFVVMAPTDATWDGVAGFITAVWRWSAPPAMTLKLGEIGGQKPVLTLSGQMDAAARFASGAVNARDYVAGLLGFVTATVNDGGADVDFASWVRRADGTGQALGDLTTTNAPTHVESSFAVVENADGSIAVWITDATMMGAETAPIIDTYELMSRRYSEFMRGLSNQRPVAQHCGLALINELEWNTPVPAGRCDQGLRHEGEAQVENAAPYGGYMSIQGPDPSQVYRRCGKRPVVSETYVHRQGPGYDLVCGTTCEHDRAECGTIPDRCGTGTLSCGTCAAGLECSMSQCVASTVGEVEPNDAPPAAKPITTPFSNVIGYMATETDKDYFKVTLPPGGRLTALMIPPLYVNPPLDCELTLYDSDGTTVVAESVHMGVERIEHINASTTGRDYYLEVHAYGDVYASTTRPYLLNVEW